MFRNPVFDMVVLIPALLVAGLISFVIMTSPARAAETPPAGAMASTSGNTFPNLSKRVITVDRQSLSSSATTTDRSAVSIHTSDDLRLYAESTLLKDPYIQSISLSNKGITVTYRREGKLLGLLPIELPRTVTVSRSGNISFEQPLYGALTLAEHDRMRTALEVRVRTLLSSEGYLSSMTLAASTQAEILDIIRELIG